MSRSSRFSIRSNLQNKMLLLALGPVLLITLILEVLATLESRRETRESLAEQRSALIESRQQGIKNLVDAAKASVSHLADAPPEQQAEAQARAREILGNVTFGGGNYLFVYDFQGNVAASRTDSVGGNSWDLQDEDGQYVIRDLIAAARDGGGYYQYRWTNPATETVEAKYSYATAIPQWDWMIGAGVYATEVDKSMALAEAEAMASLKRSMITTVLTGLGLMALVGAGAAWMVRRTVRPIRDTATAMEDIARGKGDLTRRLAVTTDDEVGELANQFNGFVARMQETLLEVRGSTRHVWTRHARATDHHVVGTDSRRGVLVDDLVRARIGCRSIAAGTAAGAAAAVDAASHGTDPGRILNALDDGAWYGYGLA
ncbi:MAG: cache domain-containing protein, partial [Alcanivorax sp.]|nr:cache domain-containing protein [Alcanivorax sp.]